MFNDYCSITQGVKSQVDRDLQLLLLAMIALMEGEKDSFQIFDISRRKRKTIITHIQNSPPYKKVYHFSINFHFVGTIYVIGNDQCRTMMLGEEYERGENK